jgi:ketosteroid isomerase-like protein
MSGSARIFVDYLDAFTSGDVDRAAELLTDDFSFAGPLQQTEGKDAFLEGARHLAPLVRGHTMLRQWEDGDEVCSIYEFAIETPAGAGSVLMSEWSRVRDGRLASSRLVFDTAAFAALMP